LLFDILIRANSRDSRPKIPFLLRSFSGFLLQRRFHSSIQFIGNSYREVHKMAKPRQNTPRKPATKFPHLRKKLQQLKLQSKQQRKK
jgi:hypothetical protein